MFSDSRASMPDSGFRMEMSGHLIGVKDAGRRTNQRAAQAAPSALTEPNMLAARQNNDSQPVANAPICSKAFATDYAQSLRYCDITTTGVAAVDCWLVWAWAPTDYTRVPKQ